MNWRSSNVAAPAARFFKISAACEDPACASIEGPRLSAAVPGKRDVSDVLTKSVGGIILKRHLATMNFWSQPASAKQKEVLNRCMRIGKQ